MMRKWIYTGLVLAALLAVQACDSDRKGKNYNHNSHVDDDGLSFINAASESGLTELEASGLVKSRSQNPRVLQYAGTVIVHYKQSGEELKKLASDLEINNIDTISLDKQEDIAELANKTGADFDKRYIKMMLDDHKRAIKLFKKGAENKKASVSAFANKNLPVLSAHLDSAKAIKDYLKKL